MKYNIIESDDYKKEWDEIAPHPLQSWAWGTARKKMGIDVVRIIARESDKLKSVFQLTFHKIPHTRLTIGYLPRTSLFDADFITYIHTVGKTKNAILIKCEPNVLKNSTTEKQMQLLCENTFLKKAVTSLFPDWTQVIDLTPSEKELLIRMKPKTRYNIRVAEKHGVIIKEMTNDDGFEIFKRLYFDTCLRQKYKGHTVHYHTLIFNALKEKCAHIFIAFYKNVPLCAYELFLWDGVLYYPYGGSSTEFKNVMAPNLLMWEVMKFGKKMGAKKFDMWGSLPPQSVDNNSAWSGFTRFKEGYNTNYEEFIGSYDVVIQSPHYAIYNLLYNLRTKFLHLF